MLTVILQDGGSGAAMLAEKISDFDGGEGIYLDGSVPIKFVLDLKLENVGNYLGYWQATAEPDDRLILSVDYGLEEVAHGMTSPAAHIFFDPDLVEYFVDPRIGIIVHSNDCNQISQGIITRWRDQGYDGGFADTGEWLEIEEYWISRNKDFLEPLLERHNYSYFDEMNRNGDIDITRLIHKLTGYDLHARWQTLRQMAVKEEMRIVQSMIAALPKQLSVDKLIENITNDKCDPLRADKLDFIWWQALLARLNLTELTKFLAEQIILPDDTASIAAFGGVSQQSERSPLLQFGMAFGSPVKGKLYTFADIFDDHNKSKDKILLIREDDRVTENDFEKLKANGVIGVVYLGHQLPGHYLMSCRQYNLAFLGRPQGQADLPMGQLVSLAPNGTAKNKHPGLYEDSFATAPGITLTGEASQSVIANQGLSYVVSWLCGKLTGMLSGIDGKPYLYANLESYNSNASHCDGIGLVRTERLARREDFQPTMQKALSGDRDALQELQTLYANSFSALFATNYLDAVNGIGGPVVIRLMDAREWETDLESTLTSETIRNICIAQLKAVRDGYAKAYDPDVAKESALPAPEDRVVPHILIPLVNNAEDLDIYRAIATEIFDGQPFKLGAMIETSEAVANIRDIARHADFCSFGTNDLTAELLALKRGDMAQIDEWMLANNAPDPFIELSDEVMAATMAAITAARATNPGLTIGICGAQATELATFQKLLSLDLDYISIEPDANALILCGVARVQHLARQQPPVLDATSQFAHGPGLNI